MPPAHFDNVLRPHLDGSGDLASPICRGGIAASAWGSFGQIPLEDFLKVISEPCVMQLKKNAPTKLHFHWPKDIAKRFPLWPTSSFGTEALKPSTFNSLTQMYPTQLFSIVFVLN